MVCMFDQKSTSIEIIGRFLVVGVLARTKNGRKHVDSIFIEKIGNEWEEWTDRGQT